MYGFLLEQDKQKYIEQHVLPWAALISSVAVQG
jgi:hypothetical protein